MNKETLKEVEYISSRIAKKLNLSHYLLSSIENQYQALSDLRIEIDTLYSEIQEKTNTKFPNYYFPWEEIKKNLEEGILTKLQDEYPSNSEGEDEFTSDFYGRWLSSSMECW